MKPTYEVQNHSDLNKFLAGVLKDIRNKKASKDEVEGITKVAAQMNKNNSNAILYQRQSKNGEDIEFFQERK